MKVAELFATLGFKTDTQGLDNFQGALNGIKTNMIGVKELIMGGLVYATKQFVSSSTDAAASMYSLNSQTGIAFDTFQKWRNAGVMGDLSMGIDEVDASLVGLEKSLYSISQGTGNIMPFTKLGINPLDGAENILEQLKEKAKTTDPVKFSSLISEMGLSPKLAGALRFSPEEFEASQNRNIRTDLQIRDNQKLGIAIQLLTDKFLFLKDVFVSDFSPQLQKATKNLGDFANSLFNAIGNVIKFETESPEKFKNLVLLAGGLFALIAPWKAAIIALAAYADDIMDFINKHPQIFVFLSDWVDNFKEGLKLITFGLGKAVTEFSNWINGLFGTSATASEKPLPQFGKTSIEDTYKTLFGDTKGIRIISKDIDPAVKSRQLIDLIGKMQETKSSVNFNNNYTINSNASAEDIANMISEKQSQQWQQNMNFSTTDFNKSGY